MENRESDNVLVKDENTRRLLEAIGQAIGMDYGEISIIYRDKHVVYIGIRRNYRLNEAENLPS